MNSVAIIGAGITGLTAGFRLAQKQIPVTIYEASDRVGGVIQSVRRNGFLAEFGPNTLLETSPKIRALIRDAGLEPHVLVSAESAQNRYLVRNRRPIAMPGSLAGFLRTPLFSPAAKLRLFAEPFIRRWHNRREENLGEFVLRRLGREFLDYAIDPLVAGIYAGDPFRLSVQHAFPKIYDLEQRYGSLIRGQILGARERKRRAEVSKQDAPKLSFDHGLQVLPETLGARIERSVRLRTRVISLRRQERLWTLAVESPHGAESRPHCAVLFAGSAYQLADLALDQQPPINLSYFNQIYYPPVTSVVLGFRRADVAHPLDGFGMLIPKVEGFSILGTLFSSSLFPNRAPEGHVTLTSYVGGVRNPLLALKSFDEILALTYKDLRSILGITGSPTFHHSIRYPRAIPQYEVGYGRFKAAMDQLENDAPGFFVAGHCRNGISMGDSLISGYDVADRIEDFLRADAASATAATPSSPAG